MSLRLAFVGRRVEHERWTLTQPAHGVEPLFVEARQDDARERLARFRPDAVVVFSPHRPQPELPRDAVAVAYVDDPIQLVHGDTQDPWAPGDDLGYALETSGGLGHLV